MNIREFYIKKSIGFIIVSAVLVVGYFIFQSPVVDPVEVTVEKNDHKNATYMIEGNPVQLTDGYAQSESAAGASDQTITRYFGNELVTDLDGDGDDDIAFVLSQETGGSGIFYYAVAALNTEDGYVGSDGYLLGDRIAPQSTNVSQNPRHVNVVVFNYVERAPGEPMTAQPSVGASVYLKVDPTTMQWGIVEPDFEGESNL